MFMLGERYAGFRNPEISFLLDEFGLGEEYLDQYAKSSISPLGFWEADSAISHGEGDMSRSNDRLFDSSMSSHSGTWPLANMRWVY